MVQQGMVALLRGASRRWKWSPQGAPPLPSMYSLSRAFISKLFVSGFPYRTDEEMLRKAFAVASTRPPPAADRTFGNSDSSSSPPSGSSFGRVGSHPLVVEDLGPLPSYGTHIPHITSTAESNNTACDGDMDSCNGSGQSINSNYTSHQKGSDAFNGGQRYHNNTTMDVFNGTYQANVSCDPKPFAFTGFSSTSSSRSTFGMASSSTTFGAALPGNSSTSVFQSSTSTSKFQSRTFRAAAFDSSTFGTGVSATATQGTVTSSSMVLPDMSRSTALQAGESGSGLGLGEVSSLDDSSQSEIGLGFSSTDSPQSGRSGLSGLGQASSFGDTAQSEGSGLGLMQGPDVSVAAQANSVDIIEIAGAKLQLGLTDGSAVSSPSTASQSESSEDYDFRNFPALKGSFYQDYERPIELQRRKRHMVLKSSSKVLALQSKLTVESIPPPKRLPYDFGLGNIPSSPPPLEVGAKPQGGFDINMFLDDLNEASSARPPGYSISSQRPLPPLDLPWNTPEADNWSEIGEEPQRIKDSIDSPFNDDLKNDPEFWWDPYDFDAEAKLPWEPEAEEHSAVNTTA